MSIGVMNIRRLPKPSEVRDVIEFRSEVEGSGTLIDHMINEVVRTFLVSSGFPQPSVDLREQYYRGREGPSLIVVANGIAVKASEYEERYSKIELEYFREHMSTEMFKAFVRHIGSIRGRTDLNVGEFVGDIEI
jgi:hypothetical protein